MNLPQAEAIVKLLREARHPRTDAITGQFYTDTEYAEFHEPTIEMLNYITTDDSPHEMMEIQLGVDGYNLADDLFLSPDGRLWSWSTIQIPREDCDCECSIMVVGRDSTCPQHGTAVRELDCYRRASVGWWIPEGRPPRWRFRVTLGDPIRDVLAEYRAERAAAKAPASIDEVIDPKTLVAKPPWVG